MGQIARLGSSLTFPHQPQQSSFAPIAVAIFQTLESYGIDAGRVFRENGFDVAALSDPHARLDSSTHVKLVACALEASEDPCFGLRFADYVHPTTFHALGVASLSSSTLRAFLRRWHRYYSFITTGQEVEFVDSRLEPRLMFASGPEQRDSPVARVLIEGQMATVIKLIRFMYRPDYSPLRAELVWPPLPDRDDTYEKYLSPDVTFGTDSNALYFTPADLDIPLPAANAELARHNDQVVLQFLARLKKEDVETQARAKLIELLPSGDCSKAKVAHALNMSVRTLHNRLTHAGTSYQRLLDSTREELAAQYMSQMNLSVSEVAYLLGFSDCSNFSRAFHRWTGLSPSAYRAERPTRLRAVK